MTHWPPQGAPLFNPDPTVRFIDLGLGQRCCVIDDVLADPQGLADWAATQTFVPVTAFPYPGVMVEAPATITRPFADFFVQHLRRALGARRLIDTNARLSLVTLAPARLRPVQWQCHRDRIAANPHEVLFAASVLYLFKEPALGGTSFYQPRRPAAEIDRMIIESQQLDPQAFSARYGVAPGYMTGSNAWFEQVARVPPTWNRLIVYDGGIFHSGDVDRPELLSADPARGRLTLNGFFACKRNAR